MLESCHRARAMAKRFVCLVGITRHHALSIHRELYQTVVVRDTISVL